MSHKIIITSLLLFSSYSNATSNMYLDTLKDLYTAFFGGSTIWKIDETGGAYPSSPRWSYKLHVNNSSYIDTGTYGHEPSLDAQFGYLSRWSDTHPMVCFNSSAARELPIRNYQSDPSKFIVNQGVPFNFRAKSHGGLTKQLIKSFYFWNFGDGIRRFNKNKHDEYASHVYHFLGNHTLSSVVYSTDFSFGIQIGGSLDGGFGIDFSPIKPLLSTSDILYLESCDSMPVKVVANNAPKAVIAEVTRSENVAMTTVTFTAAASTDPDGNPLIYTWKRNGVAISSAQRATASFATPEFGTASYTISLTVSDGGKSHTVNKTVYIGAYCYACNGFEIP